LTDYTGVKAKKARKMRHLVTVDAWFPPQRDTTVDNRFWTLTQASIYETYRRLRRQLHRHSVINWQMLNNAAKIDIRRFFTQLPGVTDLLYFRYRYVEEWVRVFYATLYIEPDRARIHFMFQGHIRRFTRERLAQLLGIELHDRRIHDEAYGAVALPRRSQVGGTVPSLEEVAPVFVDRFTARIPSQLRPEARVLR